jgi:hypothetical protein
MCSRRLTIPAHLKIMMPSLAVSTSFETYTPASCWEAHRTPASCREAHRTPASCWEAHRTPASCWEAHHFPCYSVVAQVFTKLLLTSLPHELGKFIIDSSDSAAAAAAAACDRKHAGSSSGCSPVHNGSTGLFGPEGAGVWLAGEL